MITSRTLAAIVLSVATCTLGACSDTMDARHGASRCPVHDRPLITQRVPVAYGLMDYPPGYFEAKDARFPYAWGGVCPGGCMVNNRVKYALVGSCLDCEAAMLAWKQEHPIGGGQR